MKLLSFELDGRPDFGVVSRRDGGIVRLGELTALPDLAAVLGAGTESVAAHADRPGDVDLADVRLLPPVPHPAHIFGIGLNTYSHLAEAGRTLDDAPKNPMVFARYASSVVADGQPLTVPEDVTTFDYEGEIALVVGRGGRNIDVDEALDHIAGVSCFNDGSVREYQRHSTQVTAGKNFDASGSWGPWIVTTDDLPAWDDLVLTTRVNGEQKQRLTPDDLIFGFAELVHYLSHAVTLRPGDVIATGSPAGVAVFAGPYLTGGDQVEVTIEGVATLVNPVSLIAPTPRVAVS